MAPWLNKERSFMSSSPTFLPSADESKAVIPIATAFQSPMKNNETMLLLPNGQKQAIPSALAGVLALASQAIMRGYAVSLTIHSGMVTTQEAADMLACSRQHVVKLIKEGKLPATKVPGGTHRRIRLKDLLEFMKEEDAERESLMDEMIAVTDEIGGYDEFYKWRMQKGKSR